MEKQNLTMETYSRLTNFGEIIYWALFVGVYAIFAAITWNLVTGHFIIAVSFFLSLFVYNVAYDFIKGPFLVNSYFITREEVVVQNSHVEKRIPINEVEITKIDNEKEEIHICQKGVEKSNTVLIPSDFSKFKTFLLKRTQNKEGACQQ